jgi:hypothetical protein
MNWLQKLHLIEAPEGTSLRSAELSLRGLLPLWLALLLLVVGAAGALVLYFRENARIGVARRVLLALLRTALIALVLALLLRPVLLAEFHGERPRAVVLLLDDTQSMKQQDRRLSTRDRLRVAIARGLVPPTTSLDDASALARVAPGEWRDPARVELVRDVLGNGELKLIGGLRGRGPLQAFVFDGGLRGVEDGQLAGDAAGLRGALQAAGEQTALADAIHELLVRTGAELPGAIVVMTDGRDNASKMTLEEAASACRDKGVPLFVYGVGSSEGGLLQFKDVGIARTLFVDPKPDGKDDPVEVPIRFRCRGFQKGALVVTFDLGGQVERREFPAREGEDLREVVTFVPRKGKEGPRELRATIELKGSPETRDEVRREVQVKNNRVKVLYVEDVPRREYKFIQPVLDRDRRVLARVFLVEGDPRLAEAKPDPESGSMFLDRFPEGFPAPSPRDPDKKPYDLLVLGDVPLKALGPKGAQAVQRFVKEGGGLVVIAGRDHMPGEYAKSELAEVLPVEVSASKAPPPPAGTTAQPFRPVLTYDGEGSGMLALADTQEENLRLWKEELWRYAQGFYWYCPVGDLRPGATALVVHPERKVGRKPDERPLPLLATHYYGKGEVLWLGVDETWRWRDGTGDRLTARLWGQVVARLGLPHLLGNARRTQLEVMGPESVLGRPGAVKARVLGPKYDPLTRPAIEATLVYLDARAGETRARGVQLKRVGRGQAGEYRGALPNEAPGRYELRVEEGQGVEGATLPFRVELPPRHEREQAPPAEEALRAAAATSGGKFYQEEDLHRLAADVPARLAPFAQRQEVLLWGPLTLVLFVLLVTAEWVLRKFSNLS